MRDRTGEDNDRGYRSSYERRVTQASVEELRTMKIEVEDALSRERGIYSRRLDSYEKSLGGGEGVRASVKSIFGSTSDPTPQEPSFSYVSRLQDELTYINTELEKRAKDEGKK